MVYGIKDKMSATAQLVLNKYILTCLLDILTLEYGLLVYAELYIVMNHAYELMMTFLPICLY